MYVCIMALFVLRKNLIDTMGIKHCYCYWIGVMCVEGQTARLVRPFRGEHNSAGWNLSPPWQHKEWSYEGSHCISMILEVRARGVHGIIIGQY